MKNRIFILLALLLLSAPAYATQEFERYTDVKLIPERGSVSANDEITVAIEIKLKPEWHVYWQNPGDSGLPVRIEWDAPEDFKIGDITWATPDKISFAFTTCPPT